MKFTIIKNIVKSCVWETYNFWSRVADENISGKAPERELYAMSLRRENVTEWMPNRLLKWNKKNVALLRSLQNSGRPYQSSNCVKLLYSCGMLPVNQFSLMFLHDSEFKRRGELDEQINLSLWKNFGRRGWNKQWGRYLLADSDISRNCHTKRRYSPTARTQGAAFRLPYSLLNSYI